QLEDMNKRVEQLGRNLRNKQNEYEDAKTQLATVKTNYKNLRALYEKVNTQLADALLHERQTRQDVERWRKTATQAFAEIKAAQEESGAIQANLGRIKQEYKVTE